MQFHKKVLIPFRIKNDLYNLKKFIFLKLLLCNSQKTALHVAVEKQKYDIVNLLLLNPNIDVNCYFI